MTSPVFGSNLSTVGSGMGSLWLEKILCSSKELQQENTIYLVWVISITKCTDYSFPRIRLLQKFHMISFEFCARISRTGLYPLLLCKETFKSESVGFWSVWFFCHKNGGFWTGFEAASVRSCSYSACHILEARWNINTFPCESVSTAVTRPSLWLPGLFPRQRLSSSRNTDAFPLLQYGSHGPRTNRQFHKLHMK